MALNIFPSRSIQNRVTLLTLAILLAGIWSLALYAGRMMRQDLEKLLSEQQFSTVSILASEINQSLDDRLRGLDRVAEGVRPLMARGPASMQALLEQRPVLLEAFNDGVVVVGPDGTVLAEVPRAGRRLGQTLMAVDAVAAALKEGKPGVSRPFRERPLSGPYFGMAVPVRDGDGAVVGAVYGVINLGAPSFLDKITTHRYGKSGDYFLAALRFRLNVISSDKNRTMQELPPPGVNPSIDRFMQGYEGSASYVNQHGVDILVSVKGIPIADWAMVATLPTTEAFAPIRAMERRLLASAMFLTVLAGGLTWWVTWWMLRRQLSPMLHATRTLATLSDAGQRLPVTRQDEIGELIGGFNRLLETLGQREQELRDSRERFDLAVLGSSDGIWDWDIRGGTGYVSDRWWALLGYQPGEQTIGPDGWFDRIHPDDTGRVQEHIRQHLEQHLPYAVEFRMRHKSGEYRWFLARGQALWDAQGHATRMAGSTTDITERKRAEADLSVAATAFESQEGMIITDVNQVILRVNGACGDITGYTSAECVGRTPRMFSSGRHDAAFYRDMWASIHQTGAWKGELWNRRKNGEVYPEWFSISAVKGADGKVTNYVASFIDISQRKTAEDEIRHLAFYDPLTRLPNRRLLLDRLRHALLAGARSEAAGALFFIDLDNFKNLNDTLGHDKGDLLLESVARRLSAAVRVEDTVARLGGDEFVVMMEGLSLLATEAAAQAQQVAEKILGAFHEPHDLGGLAYRCSASMGIALFTRDTDTVDDLLKRADLAMYQAKADGRNTLRFFDPDMQAVVMARTALEADLREALLKDQLMLYYQPQVDDAGRMTGAEALVRWQHPRRGMMAPLEFITLAEETGLILPLGQWVLQTACRQLVQWADQGELAQLTVAVNVSTQQLLQHDFVERVESVLTATGANPERLKLELTESLLVSNVEGAIEKMSALKARGVGFSLDDFGTGYSSLAYLKRLPLDQLKIDRSFVRDVLDDPNDAAIAKTIVALAHSLGLGVIAEGVETEAQRDFLAQAGCRAYQGYLFSQPVPVEAFTRLARGLAASP